VIAERIRLPPEVLLVGSVRGLEQEGQETLRALSEFSPEAIGLGVSGEEMRGLREYFVTAEAEPVVPLTENETGEVRGLVRFGPVRVPNPTYVDLLRWAEGRPLPVVPLDPSEAESAEMFATHIGYVELVRRTVRERSAGKRPPKPSTADEFALSWDREVAPGRGSREFARSRDGHLADGARQLGQGRSRIAIVVDRERFATVRGLLTADGAAD
jgi:hypothetical protein